MLHVIVNGNRAIKYKNTKCILAAVGEICDVLLLTVTHKTISLINANFQILNLNWPYKFVELTTLEVRIQTFEILTQRHSCALNGCSGAAQYSLNPIHTHSVCSGGVQHSLKGIHMHSTAFRGYSILTRRHSCALNSIQGLFNSHTNAIFLMVTPQ